VFIDCAVEGVGKNARIGARLVSTGRW